MVSLQEERGQGSHCFLLFSLVFQGHYVPGNDNTIMMRPNVSLTSLSKCMYSHTLIELKCISTLDFLTAIQSSHLTWPGADIMRPSEVKGMPVPF